MRLPEHLRTTPHWDNVRELMLRAKQDVPHSVTMPDENVRRLRAKLILEEALETIEGLGFYLTHSNAAHDPIGDDMLHLIPKPGGPLMVEIVDGCADLSVVTIGTLIACGVPDLRLLELVDENNLQKFGPGGYRRDDGKWVKPPGHQPPDVAGLLRQLGWEE